MEAQPMNQQQESRKADTNELKAAREELMEALKCKKARQKLRNATTQIHTLTPPNGTQAGTQTA